MSTFSATNENKRARSFGSDGFAILYTVIVIALVTGISAALLGAAFRQTRLVTTSAQSTQALAAADTGLECALFWDLQEDAFAISNPENTIDCAQVNNITVQDNGTKTDDDGRQYYARKFAISSSNADTCLTAQVRKYQASGGDPAKTEIRSFGYDDCADKAVERALRTSY